MIMTNQKSRPRLVIVEDEVLFGADLVARLEDMGYAVVAQVTTGEEAVNQAEQVRPDLILMDIVLGGTMDGIDAAAWIRSCLGVPVVFLTGAADEEILKRAKVTEPFGYLIKPVSDRELKATVDMALYKAKIDDMLRKSEEHFRSFVENANDIIYSLSLDGYFTYVSPNLVDLLGHEQAEVIGRPMSDYMHKDDLEAGKTFFERIRATGQRQSGFEYRFRHRDGSWRWHATNNSPVKDDHGEVFSYFGISRDITLRKEAEQALLNTNARYRALIHSLPVGVVSVDNVLIINEWNTFAETITGYREEEVLGHRCHEVFLCEQEDNDCQLQQAISRRLPTGPIERIIKGKNGRAIPVRMRAAPLFDQAGKVVGGVEAFQDISDVKALERQRTNIVSMLVHDMKSPLISIQGLAHRLFEKPETMTGKKAGRYLEIIFKEASKLEDLIRDFLEFSRLQAGHLKLNLIPTDIKTELAELVDTFMPRFLQASVYLEFPAQLDLPFIMADAPRLRRVFTNLLDNALSHSPAGSTVRITPTATFTEFSVTISDQGPGISVEEIPLIFEPFYRGRGDEGYKGHGLGLAGAKAIVEGHGGQILVESQLNNGSTFTVVLPVRVTDQPEKEP